MENLKLAGRLASCHDSPMPAYAVTIFTGAFLLFQVQPLIGKFILPWYGGGPGVWTACMLFFQVVLLVGYAYAHGSATRLPLRFQAVVQGVLVLAALAFLPITPAASWKPHTNQHPTFGILLLLGATIGLPYFVLSSTGPLLQHWFSRTHPGRSPYRFYALSNCGSMLALLSYPFVFEVHFSRRSQGRFWAYGLALYALFSLLCCWKVFRPLNSPSPESASSSADSPLPAAAGLRPAPGLYHKTLWLLFPACASVLLLAVTNRLCQDVAAVPFLWVLPLALYLLSFVICFENPRWYARLPFALALVAAISSMTWALFHAADWSIPRQVALYCAGLFVCCMVCHGEVYRLRPESRGLTAFYLFIALGGALGGAFVALAAPVLFTNYYEVHLGLLLCATLFFVACSFDPAPAESTATWRALACIFPVLAVGGLDQFIARSASGVPLLASYTWWLRGGLLGMFFFLAASWIARGHYKTFKLWRPIACLWLLLGVGALSATLFAQWQSNTKIALYRARNFYGVLTVYEKDKLDPLNHHIVLQHGRITHGFQFTVPEQKDWPTTYYGHQSGVGLALNALHPGFRRIGVVGLGTGTLAAHGQPGDYFRFYEINPEVQRLATSRFSFLRDSLAQIDIVPGDARLSLENEPAQHFDLLALDAFSSDSIPVHLLTDEAFTTYERHLNSNGVLAVHISNHFLDLEPVVKALACRHHYCFATIDFEENDQWWLYNSTWMLLTRNDTLLSSPELAAATRNEEEGPPANSPLWTDDFASLFRILKK